MQQPLVRGEVQLSRRHAMLLDQLTSIPTGMYDDGPDALQMVVDAARTPGFKFYSAGASRRNDVIEVEFDGWLPLPGWAKRYNGWF